MSVHRDRAHHRPRVYRAPGARTKWSFPWKSECDCGFRRSEMYWRNAWIDALIHAETIR